ncbi:TonB-dependent siderophore receptor [Pseudomonas sessilinigenes]|uniref:TonB-dependent receptor n=1 Tax=Pseudomonas sessilinigenes TaxID=658629 RepID=A0ABX8MWH1_9PSED|nr:TonB-dependent receptor [Pseudomonas sessilinigenes]AZC24003.1 Ferric siderophore receptor, TonB dependent [Pseudomonas sessilinigenes]QXH42968.1 TonB-dependent receptor [Pseudomonas sessilinigenes]
MRNPWFHAFPVAIAVTALSGPALAQEQSRSFNLPAGPLAVTLNAIAGQSGVVLSLDPGLVSGKQAPAVNGTMTPTQAMHAALVGSGLQLRLTASGHFSVEPLPAGVAGLQLGMTDIVESGFDSATTEGSNSYAARAVTIGKGQHSLREIPQSVTVMTRKQLDDQGLTDLKAAANQTTGLVGVQGVGKGMILSSRGFQIDDWQYDGVPIPRNTYSLGNWATQDLIFFDRLEVLRGASGLLQGTGSPGGAINLVRKRGQDAPTVTLTGKAGSWDHYGLQLDAGGPLNDAGTLRGRVVLDEDQSDSFIDKQWSKTHSLYGALDFDFSDDTTLGLAVSRSEAESRPMIRGLPRHADGSPVDVPRSTYSGARWNHSQINVTTLYADLEHHFNPDWTFKVGAVRMSEDNDSTQQRTQTIADGLDADGSGLQYADWVTDFDNTKIGLDMNLTGRFEGLSMEQEVTLGGNYSKMTSDDVFARTFNNGGNIFAIEHDRPPISYDSLLNTPGGRGTHSRYDIRQKGLYGSWRIKPVQDLTLVLGSRVSWYDYRYDATDYQAITRKATVQSPSTMTNNGEVTPYAGFIYDLSRQWSLYASYTDVFEPQSSRTASGSVLQPVIGTNYEVGLKGELLDGRVNTSLALFRYDQKNRAVQDKASGFACDGWYCSTASGQVRSQGLEAEVSGEVLDRLQLSAGYTYNTTKTLKDPQEQGRTFSTWTPKHMLRVWGDYRLDGEWSKVSTGLGFTSQSHTLGYERSYKVPGYTVWNARIAYQLNDQVSLALNAYNLFDKHYYISGYNQLDGNNSFGDPRNFMLSVKYTPQF